ncbi:MAG: class I SAM-dependent methyltransferase [Candidatus Hydrogenedentota bacterium]
MKVHDSGMPEEAYWESLFDVPLILDRLGIGPELEDVAELGCGYGTFTLPVAARIRGTLTTCDLEPAMIERTRQRAAEAGLQNVRALLTDVEDSGFGVADASQDGCLLFNILHGGGQAGFLRESVRALRPAGRVYVIHWRADMDTPRGPAKETRPRLEQVQQWAETAGGLEPVTGFIELPPWHWGVVLERT